MFSQLLLKWPGVSKSKLIPMSWTCSQVNARKSNGVYMYTTLFSLHIAHKDLSSKQELQSFLNESILMKEFDHPNIVGLLGVCFDTPDGYPYLILPFMINGNIRDYLKDKRVHPTNTATLPDVRQFDYVAKLN